MKLLKRLLLPIIQGHVILFLMQKIRKLFYKIISTNRPNLTRSKINQPVYFAGKGQINVTGTSFGVFPSPFFLSGSIYIEARSKDASINIGSGTFINNNAVIIADKTSISIGSNCLIGIGFTVIDSDFHGLSVTGRQSGGYITKAVEIGDNVFIGNNVSITKGVIVGANAVIGAGSVVTKNIEKNAIYAGNPALYIKNIPN